MKSVASYKCVQFAKRRIGVVNHTKMKGGVVLFAAFALVAFQLASAHPIRKCACKKLSKLLKASDPCDCDCLTAIASAPPPPPPPCRCSCGCSSYSPCDDLAELAGCGRVSFHQPLKPHCEDVYGVIDNLPPPPSPAACSPLPADAVSLALALERANKAQKKVLEENLSFGPMQKPLNGVICKPKKFIPEAGLHALKKEVVELLPISRFTCLTPEEEAEASMLAALQADLDFDFSHELLGPTLPTYNDLGYAPLPPGCNSLFVPGAPASSSTCKCGCGKSRCSYGY